VAATTKSLGVEDAPAGDVASHRAMAARIGAIKAKVVDLWPQAIIRFGFVLTAIWFCGLAWLLLAFF
jgi:hypothetical protein